MTDVSPRRLLHDPANRGRRAMTVDAFYSDPHFGHHRMAELRDFASTEEMDEALVEHYSAAVTDLDAVLWLGDAFFCSQDGARKILARLPGTKLLLRGNHDLGHSPGWYAEAGFALVADGSLYLTLAERRVQACHYPFAGTRYGGALGDGVERPDDRYTELRPVRRRGEFLLHGHTHSKRQRDGYAIHLGVDAWGLGPVGREAVEALIREVVP